MDIIQIGSNKGSDDLTEIIFKNKERLRKVILVEPMSNHHSQLKECYEEIPIIIEEIAITDDLRLNKMPLFFSLRNAPNFEVASFSKEHLKKCGFGEEIVEKEVNCMTINQLMERHEIRVLNMLFIDAEGLDDRIIRSIDFKRYEIKEIIYENLHTNSNEKLIHFLSRKNYHTISNCGLNGWSNRATKEKISLILLAYKFKIEWNYFISNGKMISRNVFKNILISVGLFKYYKLLQKLYSNKTKVRF